MFPSDDLAPTNINVNVDLGYPIITWQDNAGNEMGYEIYRSLDNINFTLIQTTIPNVQTYSDLSILSLLTGEEVTVYYKIRAKFNGYFSPYLVHFGAKLKPSSNATAN